VTVTGIGDPQVQPGERASLAAQILLDLRSGQLSPIIGQTLPLAHAAQAHVAIEARDTVAKTLLTVG
jgi:NADPH2:quinone reductase